MGNRHASNSRSLVCVALLVTAAHVSLAGCDEHERVRACTDVNSGERSCPCASDADCGLYLECSGGLCEDPREPPSDPHCYTPCRAGALVDGEFRECSAEHLMEGCVGDATCVDGTCIGKAAEAAVVPDAGAVSVQALMHGEDGGPGPEVAPTPGRCDTELDCPGHQTCIEGTCYSQCEGTHDCSGELECYRKVCRVPCSTTDPQKGCPKNSYCAAIDGETGYCEHSPADPEGQHTSIIGTFGVEPTALALSNVADSASFVIRNDSEAPIEFEVRKLSHREFDDEGTTEELKVPLFWLDLVEGGTQDCDAEAASEPGPLQVLVPGDGGEVTISICHASNDELRLWSGTVEIGNEQVGYREVTLSYTSEADGQWQGTAYYFANFGTDKLAEWVAAKDGASSGEVLTSVGNALVWRWDAMRRGQISLDNFKAAMQSAITGSWSSPTMQSRCPEAAGACYPYNDADGLESFSNDMSQRPIPSGVAELPIVMNLGASDDDPTTLIGRIQSSGTLQYSGNPAVTLRLALPSDACDERYPEACLNFIKELDASIVVGGRYYPSADEQACHVAGFEMLEVPWLPEGFTAGTRADQSGVRYHRECRATSLPFADPALAGLNKVFAGSNPIPDGRSRQRDIRLLDGLLINQEQMLLLFEERFNVGAPGEAPMVAYGVMRMSRTPATLDRTDYVGSQQGDDAGSARDLSPTVRCSPAMVRKAMNLDTLPAAWTPVPDTVSGINDLAHALISGQAPSHTGLTLDAVGQVVHYLCHETGLIDGGPNDDGSPAATKLECPAGSEVTYFSLAAGPSCGDQANMAAQPCQQDGSCEGYLFSELPAAAACNLQLRPNWACKNDARYCDDNRTDLRAERLFFADAGSAVFLPLHNAVDQAFLYKTAFVSRKDKNLGFVPSVCAEDGVSIPYCYDPGAIEAVTERIDCALSLYINRFDSLTNERRTELRQALELNFAVEPDASQKDGFETLFAELSIMLGDDAYTAAFASRFDLAGTRTRSFQGESFEEDGINLSGIAGYEMHALYLATQHYQMALDRFYALMPLVRTSIAMQRSGNAGDGFITQESVTNYFDRLIRASSQKARAWSEVAKRYQGFNQPELARRVVERAYTATYLESVLIARLMHEVADVVKASEVAQIDLGIQQALRLYRAALLDMRDVYGQISDDVTFFGFAQDYIPFPALDPGDVNAFEKLMAAAWESVEFARDKENRALDKARDFEVDEESFQSELVSIRNNYEGQLGELCGLFPVPPTGEQWVPAIAKYAHLMDELARLGEPCGAVGSGAIHEAIVNQSIEIQELEGVMLRRKNKQQEMQIEADRLEEHCASVLSGIDGIRAFARIKQGVNTVIHLGDLALGIYDEFRTKGKDIQAAAECQTPTVGVAVSPGNCPFVAAALVVKSASDGVYTAMDTALKITKFVAEEGLAIAEMEMQIAGLAGQCDLAMIDSAAKIKLLALEKTEIEQDIEVKVRELALAEAQVRGLRDQAKRLQIEQAETEQLALNVEAARNDPNVRIYKNDAVISADRAFQRALKAAYKATKVYEYYTSQSYARMENLFLIRMIQAGDFSLEDYLFELESAYTEFEEAFGNPDHRVAIISLRDDILGVPRVDALGQSISEDSRQSGLRRRLTDPQWLDDRGHIAIPFSTSLDVLSPLTRNHKIRHIEAELVGTDVGDALGRIYLRQRGTGTLRSVSGDKLYYALPDKTAVIDTFFNGARFGVFSDEQVLRSERFRDLPFANSAWELVINQRDEHVNQDINLESISDIRLYVYYTDFTEL